MVKKLKAGKFPVATVALILLGVVLVIAGIISGDCRLLYMKAVFVCMECAGIG